MYPKRINNTKIFLYALPAIIIFTIIYLIRGHVFEDDAYIFYRYATNWASGYGPVYNIGEYVEGYSSFLWTAILAIGSFFSFDPIKLAPSLNLIIGILCLFLISYLSIYIQFSRERLMAIGLPLLCAVSYGFYYYGASGMDSLIFSLVLLFSIVILYHSLNTDKYLLSLIPLILLDIVRAEGVVYSIPLLTVLIFFAYKKYKDIPKQLVLTICLFAGITIIFFVFRYIYYHELVPATVLAKGYGTYIFKKVLFSGDSQAAKDFIQVIKSGLKYEYFLFFIGAWIPFVMLLWKENRNNALLWMIAVSIVMNVFVTIWAGGDYFPFKRHIISVLPLLIIFIAWSVDSLSHIYWSSFLYKKAITTLVASLILISWIGFFTKPFFTTKNNIEDRNSIYLQKLGSMLNEVTESTTLLTNMIGKISYYAGSHVYVRDILGLTDIHNAKYGDVWGFNPDGRGACGRTDFNYSFTTPFDVFFYNSRNMHNRFISFCKENPSLCKKYRFFKREDWIRPQPYIIGIIANIEHPVSTALQEKFGAVALPIDENLKDIIR